MTTHDYRQFIRELPGKGRCDLTLLFAQAGVLPCLLDTLTDPFREFGVTKVAGIDAMGFLLTSGIAERLNVGVALLRKAGKVAWNAESVDFVDYTGKKKSLEIAVDAIDEGDNVLVVDDWAETGSQLLSAITLVERVGGNVIGVTLINADKQVKVEPRLAKYLICSALD